MIQDLAPLYFIELAIKLLHTLHLYPRFSIRMIPSPIFSFGLFELITGPNMLFSAYCVRSES
ncbi:hypothetical protein BH18THE2_BH18THE2_30510 [soil metagenome]